MSVELKITGENTTEMLIHLSELGDIAHAILNPVSGPPLTPTDTLKRLHGELEQELKEVLVERKAEVPAGAVASTNGTEQPKKNKGGRPRKVAAPAPVAPVIEEEEEEEPVAEPEQTPVDILPVEEPEKEEAEEAPPPQPADPKALLAKAANILSTAYHTEKGKPLVKSVLSRYGVTKFSEFPIDRVDELMVDARNVQEQMA